MHESILPPPQLYPEDMILDFERDDDAFDTESRGILEVIESSDETLVKLAEELGIQFDYDGSVLTPEQRQALLNKCLTWLGYDGFDTAPFEIREEAKEPSDGEMTKEEREALGKQFDYDGSRLTPEQRRALFKSYWAMHLKMLGLRSPRYYAQYYGDKSQCLSVSDTAWPGMVTYLEAEKLKRVFIEPEDLIERLGKLKPSDNFELRKFRHPPILWKSPTPLQEEGFEIFPPNPDWLIKQLYAVNDMEKRMVHQQIRKSAAQFCQDIRDRWAAFESGVELTPLPDLHLLRDMGRSPGGTLFPWYLVKGLMTLREHANDQGGKLYDEEYESAMVKREKAINRWRERNPHSILADDPISIYKTWPADLMDELNEIDREAIRCGRRKYVALLREAETKMQTLVAFWRDCGLVTGQRTPPLCWWQDPKAKVKRLPEPQHLQERLVAIRTKFGHSGMANKLRIIEWSRWMESMINGDSEPAASNTPLPQSLLDDLDIVWQVRDWLGHDDMEDEMIARFRRWRKSKHQQRLDEGLRTSPQLGSDTGPEEPVQTAIPGCSGQKNSLRDGASSSVMTPEEMLQLRKTLPRKTYYSRGRRVAMAEDQAIWRGRLRSRTKTEGQTSWRDRLRPRPDADGASRKQTKATKAQSGKPQGIVKRGKASKKKRLPATKRQATTSISHG